MKGKSLSFTLLLFTLFMLIAVVGCNPAYAEREGPIQNETLIVKNFEMGVLPEGFSAELVNNLITGQLKELVIENEKGEKTYFFAFPIIKTKVEYSREAVTYRNGELSMRPMTNRVERPTDWLISVPWLFSIFLITVTIVINVLSKMDMDEFLFLYFIPFVGMTVGGIVGLFFGFPAGIVVGGIVGAVICGFSGLVAGASTISTKVFSAYFSAELNAAFLGGAVGIVVGASMGVLVGGFAGMHNGIAWWFFFFLFLIEIVSFFIAKGIELSVGLIKKRATR